MNIVDTSGWLAFFNGESNADIFSEPIGNTDSLIVPTICIYEVFKFVKLKNGESEAVKIIAHMKLGNVLPVTENIALEAANISIKHKLAVTDSLIYAGAQIKKAVVWTQDIDFEGLPGVNYYPKGG
ncbi:MAG: type II toxin-antitoxin system VapC family toxin [Deltaproteobacteria bacterium]|nr:type II toxin-antitoxin system VapC family toxin [Deltaproteobacteria bacterium]